MILDSDQQRAVHTTEGPVAIIAGPGSGKTFTIVERIFYLVTERRVDPTNILAITFTVKASLEMRERLAARLGENAPLPTVCTFHAFAHEIVRRFGTLAPEIDFDVLLLDARDFLKNNADIHGEYQNKFRYILVDEYQDTSPIQAEILDLLAEEHKNICIIGDPNQAIYGFRGADVQQFLSFAERYPDAKKIFLQNNYRSHPDLVSVFQNFSLPLDKGRLGGPPAGRAGVISDPRIFLTTLESSRHEAQFIVRTIRQLLGGVDMLDAGAIEGEYHAGDIAVLYRLHAVGQALEKTFAQLGIPYTRVGTKNFFEYADIREVLERLRVRNLTRPLSEEIENIVGKVTEDTRKADRLRELCNRAVLYDRLPPNEARDAFLQDATLTTADVPQERSRHAVTLMSAHAAKGLEFPVVFIAGLQDGLFPYIKKGEECDFAEEKRILYVAMTRAKEKLYLTHARIGELFGDSSPATPSRFLVDLPNTHVDCKNIFSKQKKPNLQQRLF